LTMLPMISTPLPSVLKMSSRGGLP